MAGSELKPVRCGCGGEAKIISYLSRDYCQMVYYVRCEECGTETDDLFTESEAITAWNRAMGERTAKATRNPQAFFYHCECGYALCCEKNDMNYCPNCGARLEWE